MKDSHNFNGIYSSTTFCDALFTCGVKEISPSLSPNYSLHYSSFVVLNILEHNERLGTCPRGSVKTVIMAKDFFHFHFMKLRVIGLFLLFFPLSWINCLFYVRLLSIGKFYHTFCLLSDLPRSLASPWIFTVSLLVKRTKFYAPKNYLVHNDRIS